MPTLRHRRRRFVIVFPGRAGGTYLATGLGEHPRVVVKTEPLGMVARQGADAQVRWTAGFLRGPMVGRAAAAGFSTKVDDIARPDVLTEDLRRFGARVILLDRANEVKQAVSAMRSRRLNELTGHWNRRAPEHELGATVIDPAELADRLTRIRARRLATIAYAEALELPVLRLDYADLLTDPTTTFRRAQEHIGVPPRPVAGSTFKLTSDDLRASIANFDELRDAYVGTEYEPMFDEVLQP